ncbi:MAG: dihydrodipicolinate synthase family protein [Armatimonadetes bacterium]|jgi:dihydrodipicolinate synthase/N-acetylneuraminate lyase|nr:dihydrodipicolinate synthase family protein [Armatimonadota bacterium]
MPRERLRGIFTPNMVPLDSRGRINEGELRRLVEFLIQRGVHGLYPNGTMGEFVRFSFEEHKEIVRIVVDQNRGRAKVLAGAAEFSLEKTLAACEYYAELGCDTVAVVPPWYYRLSQESVYEHFATLARHSPIDITLYNIPQFTNNEISIDVLKRLVELPRIVAIKDSSRDMPRFLNTINEVRPLRPDFSFLIGCEEILVPTLLMGGDGGTVATAGVVPEVVVEMFRCVERGDFPRAVALQYRVLHLINTMLFGAGFPEGFRAAMELRGFRMGESRQPLAPGERCNIEALRQVLHELLKEFDPDPLVPPPPVSPVCATQAAANLSEEQVRAVVREVLLRLRQEGSR